MKKILIYALAPLILIAVVITGYKVLKQGGSDYIFLITLDTTRADFVKYSTGRAFHRSNKLATSNRGKSKGFTPPLSKCLTSGRHGCGRKRVTVFPKK